MMLTANLRLKSKQLLVTTNLKRDDLDEVVIHTLTSEFKKGTGVDLSKDIQA